jgi:hypothetical protein
VATKADIAFYDSIKERITATGIATATPGKGSLNRHHLWSQKTSVRAELAKVLDPISKADTCFSTLKQTFGSVRIGSTSVIENCEPNCRYVEAV